MWFADVAQSVARRLGKAEVTGSSPAISLQFLKVLGEKHSQVLFIFNFLFSRKGYLFKYVFYGKIT